MLKQMPAIDMNLVQPASIEPIYHGGENLNLRDLLLAGRRLNFHERTDMVHEYLNGIRRTHEALQCREIFSAADRELLVHDEAAGSAQPMLMFGSNNYLGLANHPHVKARVAQAIAEFGVGIGGPPLLNGFTHLHREAQDALARVKGSEDALIFSSGYGANVGVASALIGADDVVLYDAYSHASFCDGLKMTSAKAYAFAHNDMSDLVRQLDRHAASGKDLFIAVEGVYSMDGDVAPLDEITVIADRYQAIVLLDDAHGLGVLGAHGYGSAEAFGLHGAIPVTVGTFSKTLGVTGGFVAASRAICDYLRYLSRPYMFSASLPPPVLGAVLGGLEVIEKEPELMQRLHDNVQYALAGFARIGLPCKTDSAILPIRVPQQANIRKAAYALHQLGIFVNSIEYPAVPVHEQRFRISIMATHTRGDIDRLISAFEQVWTEHVAPSLNDLYTNV